VRSLKNQKKKLSSEEEREKKMESKNTHYCEWEQCGNIASNQDGDGMWYCDWCWWPECAKCGCGFSTYDLGSVPEIVITSLEEHNAVEVLCTECFEEEE